MPINPADSLPADVRKKARRITRDVVNSLQSQPESSWQGILTAGIMKAPGAMSQYLKAVTIKRALLEAGATEEMVSKLLANPQLQAQAQTFQIPLE